MKKPVLVIMAAGMGSRYGGLKQIDPVDPEGHIIMDFSLYDAKKAGFEEVIFIIKKENEKDFKETIGNRISKIMKVSYVFQELTNLPEVSCGRSEKIFSICIRSNLSFILPYVIRLSMNWNILKWYLNMLRK